MYDIIKTIKEKEAIKMKNVNEIIDNYTNLDAFVKDMMIERIKDNKKAYTSVYGNDLGYTLFDLESMNDVVFASSSDDEKLLGHFLSEALKIADTYQTETGTIELDVENLLIIAMLEISSKICSDLIPDSVWNKNLSEKDLDDLLDKLNALDDDEMNYID